MPLGLLNNKDFWAGLMLVAIGATAMAIARDYPFGTALRMGPGYFPMVLGALLILFGLSIMAAGLRRAAPIEGSWSSLVLFGVLMDHGGFVPAMLVLIFGSATASTEFKFLEALLFSIALTALAVAVFVLGLGLPYPLLAGFD